jgi:hypothetical protein
MFGFIAWSLVLVSMIVDCAALDAKYVANELEWNARQVLLAQTPRCVKAVLAERCCRGQSLILLQAFDGIGAGRDSHILPE